MRQRGRGEHCRPRPLMLGAEVRNAAWSTHSCWQGRFDEAQQLIDDASADPSPDKIGAHMADRG
jgi:hypothetical protein